MFDYPAWAAHPYLRSPSRSLLPESIRREIAALNAQYLATVVAVSAEDAPLCWRGEVVPSLSNPRLLDAMAACPFTLFELKLDEIHARDPAPASVAAPAEDWPAPPFARNRARESIAHSALTLAWRLAESSPLSLRLTLGLSVAAELALHEMRVTSLAAFACEQGLLSTRWVAHTAFWNGLLRAAQLGDAALAARFHCLGITLLAAELGPRARNGVISGAGAGRCAR
jgi:hypothetical protein